jgi:ribosomal protein S12 methylthiotransferase accessory factor
LIDPEFPSPDGPVRMHFPGWGTDLDTRRALLRAVTEAVQARVLVMQGARDTVEGGGIIERAWTLRRTTDFTHPRTLHAFDGGRSASTGDQREDLREACRRVARAGFERVIVADVTRPDLGVPVVRVIVPGMGGPLRYGLRPSWRLMGRLV